MNAERFQKLIQAVEDTPDTQWDMSVFLRKTPCGTVACAAGHYVLRNPGCGLILIPQVYKTPSIIAANPAERVPGWTSTAYLAEHFEISVYEADDLFSPSHDSDSNSRLAVLDRLREFYAANLPAAEAGVA